MVNCKAQLAIVAGRWVADNGYAYMGFKVFVHNICAQLLFHTFIHIFCSKLLYINFYSHFWKKIVINNFVFTNVALQTPFIDNLCSQIFLKTLVFIFFFCKTLPFDHKIFSHFYSQLLLTTFAYSSCSHVVFQNLFTIIAHNSNSQLMFKIQIHNSCQQLMFTTFFLTFVHNFCCQAQFKSSSSSVQLRTETGLIIIVRPTHPTYPPTHPPTHPGQVYCKYPGSWNLVCKIVSQI